MATTFKKQFIANGLAAHVIKRKSGKNSFCYEIRYRSNGFEISAAANNLNKAKAKFLQKTVPQEIEKYRTKSAIPRMFVRERNQSVFSANYSRKIRCYPTIRLHSLFFRLTPLRNRRRNTSRRKFFNRSQQKTQKRKNRVQKNSRAEAGAGTDRMEQTAHRRFAPLEN